MRLLDHVAQCTSPFVVRQATGQVWRLTGASDAAQEVINCPLRYVIADDLLRACIELAYSEGTGLSACLDLVHFPSERVWIEWDGAVQRSEIARALPECARWDGENSLRHGVLVSADAGGRTGSFRTFWLSPTDPAEPMMAPVESFIGLDGDLDTGPVEALLDGGAVAVSCTRNAQIDKLLRRVSFRLSSGWQRYYAAVVGTAAQREDVIQRSLGTVAFNAPILMALFLLLSLRSELVQAPISRERLNAKRLRNGRRPLLAHIEVSCPVLATEPHTECLEVSAAARTAPRLHHVRGHLVRRENMVFWRRSHWRGHLRLGAVRSRTVTLRLPAAVGSSPGVSRGSYWRR